MGGLEPLKLTQLVYKIAICTGEYVFATFIKIFASWGSEIVKIGPKSMKMAENDKNLIFLDLWGH